MSLMSSMSSRYSTSSIHKSPSDTKSYKFTRLENGLKVLLALDGDLDAASSISSNNSLNSEKSSSSTATDTSSNNVNDRTLDHFEYSGTMAACALSVRVGTFDDPDDLNGLAHFVEHMLFLGNEKYPRENGFDVLLKKWGGSANAMTTREFTTYYFTCSVDGLSEALDYFAHFFESPLFRKDRIEREVKAIDSEFRLSINSDQSRLNQIIAGTGRLDNPVRKFTWGNSKSLLSSSMDNLHASLIEFHRRYYTADRMTLSILARVPLTILERSVRDNFSRIIRTSSLVGSSINLSFPYFEPDKFNRLFYVRPVKNIDSLTFLWQIPSLMKVYRSKPDVYLGYLFEHEVEGGLFWLLKNKLWALSIQAGVDSSDCFHSNRLYALFKVQLSLTDQGLRHIDDVVKIVFNYVRFVKNQIDNNDDDDDDDDVKKEIYDQLKRSADIAFKFQDEISMTNFVSQTVENLHYYAVPDVLTGPYLIDEYKPRQVVNLLGYLVVDNAAIIVQSQSFVIDEKTRRKQFRIEPWFKTLYGSYPIPDELLINRSSLDDFRLPRKNPYLPTDFDILPFADNEPSKYPLLIKSNDTAEYWYKRDTTFKLPFVSVSLHLISPYGCSTAKTFTMLDLYVDYLYHVLEEKMYLAKLARLNYELYATENGGLEIRLYGFHEKIPHLLRTISNTIRRTLTTRYIASRPEVFNTLKIEYAKFTKNVLHNRYALADQLRRTVIQTPFFDIGTRSRTSDEIKLEDFVGFLREFFDRFYVQSLCEGNLTRTQAVRTVDEFVDAVRKRPLTRKSLPFIHVRQLPVGRKTIAIRSYERTDANSLISLYLQWGPAVDLTEYVALYFFSILMEEPLYTRLRTREQLGYDVHGYLDNTSGILGLNILVQWTSDKFTPTYVEERIRTFLDEFRRDLSSYYTKEEFRNIREATVANLNYRHDNLYDEALNHWIEIVTGRYEFDRNKRTHKRLARIKLPDIERTVKKLLDDKTRQLTVIVLGDSTTTDLEHNDYSNDNNNNNSNNNNNKKSRRSKYVTNIEAFRRNLPVFPKIKRNLL